MSNQEKDYLFYLCSLIEYISRKTKNHRGDVVKIIGREELQRLYNLASVNHCLSFEQVSDEVIRKCNIFNGEYDTVSNCKHEVPSYKDIGANYKRIILNVNNGEVIDTLYDVFTSFISDVMSNFNSDFYYQNDSYMTACYLDGKVLE